MIQKKIRVVFQSLIKKLITFDLPARFIVKVIVIYIRFVYRTTKWTVKYSGEISSARSCEDVSQCIILSWHGQVFVGILLRYLRNKQICVLSSSHKGIDSVHHLASILGNINVVRRYLRNPKVTMSQVLSHIERGNDFYVTPDGSRGPRMRLKNTTLMNLAKKYSLPIVNISFATNRMINMNRWDKMTVPLPFGSGIISLHQEIPIAEYNEIFDIQMMYKLESTMIEQLNHCRAEMSLSKIEPGTTPKQKRMDPNNINSI